MDWGKAAIAGFIAGIVRAVYDYIMYCLIMRDTLYLRDSLIFSPGAGAQSGLADTC